MDQTKRAPTKVESIQDLLPGGQLRCVCCPQVTHTEPLIRHMRKPHDFYFKPGSELVLPPLRSVDRKHGRGCFASAAVRQVMVKKVMATLPSAILSYTSEPSVVMSTVSECGGDKIKPPDEATIGLFSRLGQPQKLLCRQSFTISRNPSFAPKDGWLQNCPVKRH